jgi:hypothetical protein
MRAVTAKQQARTLAVDGATRTVASTAAKAKGSCDCPMPTYSTQAHFKNDLRKRETNQRSARRKRGTPQTVVTHARQLGVIYARRLGETTLILGRFTLHSVLSSDLCPVFSVLRSLFCFLYSPTFCLLSSVFSPFLSRSSSPPQSLSRRLDNSTSHRPIRLCIDLRDLASTRSRRCDLSRSQSRSRRRYRR